MFQQYDLWDGRKEEGREGRMSGDSSDRIVSRSCDGWVRVIVSPSPLMVREGAVVVV